MLAFGHLGITLFLGALFSLSLIFVGIGALLPDLIDKPLQLLGLAPNGRYTGHTLFLGAMISILAYAFKRKKLISLSLFFGYAVHLIEDSQYFVPWFFPFLNYDFIPHPFTVKLTPFNIGTEIFGIVLLSYVFYSRPDFRKSVLQIPKNFWIKLNGKKPR